MNARLSLLAFIALFLFAGWDLMNSIGVQSSQPQQQVSQLIEQGYPGVEVIGSTYPVPALKMVAFVMVFFGHTILPALGLDMLVGQLARLQQNKFAAVMGIWFVGNTIANGFISTGAFEVFCDGNLVFSKLAEGRMPQLNELYASMTTCMEAVRARNQAMT